MSRITPASGTATDVSMYEDFEPYRAKLVSAEIKSGSTEYPDPQLVVDWQIAGMDPKDTLRDWIGLKLGTSSSGNVAKLRQLINALAGRPRDAEVSFFDDSSFEFGFSGADGEAAAMLGVGDKVILRGQQGTKKDGITRVFRVTHYQPYVDPSAKTAAKAESPAGGTPASRARTAAVAATNPDDIPF